jgi:Thrombospondin type 3 repeat
MVDPNAVAYEWTCDSVGVPWHFACSVVMDQFFLGGQLSMCVKKSIKKFIEGGLAAFMFFVMAPAAMAGQASPPLTGAIFTTDENSTFVNGNVYDDQEDVYLNGGPRPNAPCTAAGLPDGDYYFQVTDPSGKMLLSTDDVTARQVHVLGGVIAPVVGAAHQYGTGKCPGSVTVQLSPYSLTPNDGGEYKVWMTRVIDYDKTQTLGSFGFIPSKTKTDNFKVVAPLDTDGDGIPDSLDNCPTVFDPTNTCGGTGGLPLPG